MLPPSKNTCSKNADCTIENTASYCSKYGCRCRYNCHRFGFSEENSICAYPSNGDALIDLQIFGNACELNYYQCITKQDFLIACTGSSCSDDWCSSAIIDDGFQRRICKNNDASKRCSNNGICLERTIDSRYCKCPNGYTGALCDTKIDYRLPSTTVQKCEVSDRDFYSSCRPCYITNIATVAIFATVFGIILLRRPQKHQNTLNRRVSLSKCTSERSLIGNERDETLASLIDFSRERNRIGRIRSISGGSAGPFSRSNSTRNNKDFDKSDEWTIPDSKNFNNQVQLGGVLTNEKRPRKKIIKQCSLPVSSYKRTSPPSGTRNQIELT